MGTSFRPTYPFFYPRRWELDAPDPELWETLQWVYIYICAILACKSQKRNTKTMLHKKITLWQYKYVCMYASYGSSTVAYVTDRLCIAAKRDWAVVHENFGCHIPGRFVGVAYSRNKLALRSRLRNLSLRSQFWDIHVQTYDFLKFVGDLWALRWAWQTFFWDNR